MNTGKWILTGLLLVASLPGCSSDDAGNAPQKCDDLLTRFCSSTTSCQVSGGLLKVSDASAEDASCKADVREQLKCSRVRRVSAQYNDCMDALADPPCDDINQAIVEGQSIGLPPVCDEVLLVD